MCVCVFCALSVYKQPRAEYTLGMVESVNTFLISLFIDQFVEFLRYILKV